MSVKLTDAQLVMMSAAAQREDRCDALSRVSSQGRVRGMVMVAVDALD
jgi:hypothetical protein